MPRLILPEDDLTRLIRERRRCGGDRFDEVWNGTYAMSPLADDEHQGIAARLASAILEALGNDERIHVHAGANVSHRPTRWKKNDRCPDGCVDLPDNPAENRGSHRLGGPDFAVEVIRPQDKSREKLDFYANVAVRELLLIDRKPWRLELYRPTDGRLEPAGVVEPGSADPVVSQVVPVSFRLTADAPRPRIEVRHQKDGRVWFA